MLLKRPPGLGIIVGVEVLAGLMLLFQAVIFHLVRALLPSVVSLAAAMLVLVSAVGLWLLKKWAWLVIVVFSLLSIALGAFSLMAKVFMGSEYLISKIFLSVAPKLVLDFIIVVYLLNQKVRRFFGF